MFSFKEFLMKEHETSPHDRQLALTPKEQLDALEHGTQLQHSVSSAVLGATFGTMALYLYKNSESIHTIILTSLTDQARPVGHVQLVREAKYWIVQDLWLDEAHRGAGIITNLYRVLTADGYKLRSGLVVSGPAEKVWKRLGELKIAKVLDAETGEIEDFSLKPIGSGDMREGVPARYFWITEGQPLLTVYHRLGHVKLAEGLQDWLRGTRTERTLGMGTFIVEAEV
jgi:hypothetical protein